MKVFPRVLLALLLLATSVPAQKTDPVLRLGLIGLDTSHVIAFTSRFNEPDNPNRVPGAKVVAAFKGGSADIPSSINRVPGYTKTLTEKHGVRIYDDIAEMCKGVDAVLLTSLDGRPHLKQAKPVIAAGKPLFIDKPVAGSVRDAVEIFRLAREAGVPCFSSSSLRWYPGVVEVATADVGELRSAISYGPAPSEPHHPSLFWYGIHPTESLFTVLGPGCQSVVATESKNTIVVTGKWANGSIGTLHGIRGGKTSYKVTAFGSKAIAEQKSGGDYTPMLREILKFFRTGKPPVATEVTLEIYAFMEAADESIRQGGKPVSIPEYLKKNGWQK
ncbi:MAG: Gfo/Idh/MocA family oxidoreductase [Roseibacillus sp.]|jgi:predicted dehydrogenase|nr:Gfo/Idh/MocA family oxidoreductase [Roseibacillus sp.]MDP7308115.1 Gfo/Idh/MocA family oxidoreductase [Roseibacillus sp.]MDP7655792.1 Gfo/Idh/MocA family oxidoreductase [Roseibacillus sp.]HJM63339.1 Gfo/Idh/MocA family oxidoreductase [Roseibacillus sp.]|tara:strand:+ start:1045 stop:2037 length:993 start_codon:yes stop_codon:yes gene_type:complete